MRNNPYHIHAICIHDGNAYGGHYYSFIKDHFNNKWRQFNDIRVTEVAEEEVFKQANGGSGFKTAYWVVYIDQQTLNHLSTVDIYKYKCSEGHLVDNTHVYQQRVTGAINMLVEEDN